MSWRRAIGGDVGNRRAVPAVLVCREVAIRTLSPVHRGEGRVRGERCANYSGRRLARAAPHPNPLPRVQGRGRTRGARSSCVASSAAVCDSARHCFAIEDEPRMPINCKTLLAVAMLAMLANSGCKKTDVAAI